MNLSRTSIKRLPQFIYHLYNLQTLLLRNYPYLTLLPNQLKNLISLHHLDITKTNNLLKIPIQINKLNKIRTLTNFIIDKNNITKISTLHKFHNLKNHLTISKLQNIYSKSNTSKTNLKTKIYLNKLTLK